MNDEEYRQIYATALRLLTRREHSSLELRNKLLARDLDERLIMTVLDELIEQDLLSEQRFAEFFVRGRFERGYGPVRIRAELRERGISANGADAGLADLSGAWVESAMKQREKRFGAHHPDEFRERARQMRFLQQRGFSGEQIRAAFQE